MLAFPLTSGSVPRLTAPSCSVTDPVGIAVAGALTETVMVNVTVCPRVDGFADELTFVVVVALLTVCCTAPDVLLLKVVLPPYTAVIECFPGAKDELLNLALPAANVPAPKFTAPSLNITVPAGTPAAGAAAVTVAVKVTGWLNTGGPTDESTVMCVAPLFTVCAKAGEVLVRNMPLPLYIAVMESVPTARLELVSVA